MAVPLRGVRCHGGWDRAGEFGAAGAGPGRPYARGREVLTVWRLGAQMIASAAGDGEGAGYR